MYRALYFENKQTKLTVTGLWHKGQRQQTAVYLLSPNLSHKKVCDCIHTTLKKDSHSGKIPWVRVILSEDLPTYYPLF